MVSDLQHGDCLELLSSMQHSCVDSLVTDPPAGISFMGKAWDDDKGGRDQWIAWLTDVMRECHRVLKPGAHGLVWALPRTSHWTATALENAGFEIRDVVTHLFGTGFPKSMDISKAIDKAAGVERELGPTVGELNGRNTANHKKAHDVLAQVNGWDKPTSVPTSEAAKKWQGYGTALKPAAEFWVLIRKPLSEKTVAANVLKHGTGGINIDGCRIDCDAVSQDLARGRKRALSNDPQSGYSTSGRTPYKPPSGRFPANLVLSHNDDCESFKVEDPFKFAGKHRTVWKCSDGCAVRMLDEQSGTLKSGSRAPGVRKGLGFHGAAGDGGPEIVGSEGGASRFFYVAKASKTDKGVDNTHPTVKSTALMEYLIKLVTPEGGIVLDPFAGSGSTGVAAARGGFRFMGMEADRAYWEIASRRLCAQGAS